MTLRSILAPIVFAQIQGQICVLPVIDRVPYTQNLTKMDFIWSIIGVNMILDWNLTYYDTTTCATWTELVATKPKKPYVTGMRMQFDENGEYIIKMDSIVTTGDWVFNANATNKYFQKEKWDPIPKEKQDTQETLKKAADAYADMFSDRSRGGATTCRSANSTMANTCVLGIPTASNVTRLVDKQYIIDEEYGTVQVMMNFAGLPDSHMFRLEVGKMCIL
ncbi:hypothetical protein K469DRAFT_732901 [Zopfia rhizophila CBS 207.26]|uniref:DUF8021 domain-containing protein n=1 Tax=Zopfia rhizophila CBS 207.26 TaxID=1314779 RepID=A0A6A6ELC0_9PEZI|nr:hypothetical protein K469DRAFT_732901 [Zopfia rhizophila CBS 207.26]